MGVLLVNSSVLSNIQDDPALNLSGQFQNTTGNSVFVTSTGLVDHTETQGDAIAGLQFSFTYIQIDGIVTAEQGWAISLQGSNNLVKIGTGGVISAYGITFSVTSDQSLDNTVVNDGLIFGDVIFDYGSNVYDGTNGRIVGTVSMGADNDTVTGGNFADKVRDSSRGIFGDSGDDTVSLGAGNDTYYYTSGNDIVDGGAGIDVFSVESAVGPITIDLGLGVATLGLRGDIVDAIGFENIVSGPSSRFESDVFIGSSVANRLYGGEGDNTISGLDGNARIYGSQGKDVLNGGTGADLLNGGSEKDTMTGGTGNDHFVFRDGDTGTALVDRDTITDFTVGQDKINLRLMDANLNTIDDDAFIFTTATVFNVGDAGKVRMVVSGTSTFVYINNDNDSAIDAIITLNGALTLAAADFVL